MREIKEQLSLITYLSSSIFLFMGARKWAKRKEMGELKKGGVRERVGGGEGEVLSERVSH